MLYTLWRSYPDNVTLKGDYKNYAKLLDKVIKDAKIKYEKDQMESCSNNPKKLWKFINSSLSKKNSINSLNVNNEKLDNKCDIANYMNTYFCDVGLNLSNKIKRPTNVNIPLLLLLL